MKFQPWGKRLLVKREEVKTQTASGLYIPEQAKEKPLKGVIVAAGPDVTVKSATVGTTVIFGKYAGTDINVEGVEHLLLNEDEVLGSVIEDEKFPNYKAAGGSAVIE